jgi:hypothetical protein
MYHLANRFGPKFNDTNNKPIENIIIRLRSSHPPSNPSPIQSNPTIPISPTPILKTTQTSIHNPIPHHPSPPTSPTSPLHRQKSKMAAHNRPSEEIRPREPTILLRLIQVRERTIGSSFVQPSGHAFENLGASLRRRDGCCLEFPVGLCVQVAGVEGKL